MVHQKEKQNKVEGEQQKANPCGAQKRKTSECYAPPEIGKGYKNKGCINSFIDK